MRTASLVMVPSEESPEDRASERARLQQQLLAAVKNCQKRFGGRTELATELDPYVSSLCSTWEQVLSHGLKNIDKKSSAIRQVTDLMRGSTTKITVWDVVQGLLTSHERERYELLHQVWTDRGRYRAWIRSAINERSLERYMKAFIASPSLKTYYEEWAFVCDQELNSILLNKAAGLSSILFALSIDKPELNHISCSDPYENSAVSINEKVLEEPPPAVKKRKDGKKAPSQIISFGDEEVLTDPVSNETQITTFIPSSVVSDLPSVDCEIPGLGEIECAEEATGALCDLDLSNSNSDNEVKYDDSSTSQSSSGLRPVNNANIGELIPVRPLEEAPSSEDSISEAESTGSALGNIEIGNTNEKEKDDIESLQAKLDQCQEANILLNAQLSQLSAQHLYKENQLETRIQELNRENELLKNQLRKYVSAVQMLKQDGQDFQGEELYQQKLVQVAEMHGELMELNDRVQRNIVTKELMIRRLYLELEALRGPLGPTEIDVSTHIISLWIPSVFLKGSPKPHHVYQIHLRIGQDEWNVYRRYSQFYTLHTTTKKQYPIISAFQFPPKKTLGNKDAKFVEERRLKLQQYLRRLLNHIIANNPQLSSCPSKTILISTTPFFGEPTESPVPRSSARPALPRPSNSPQYTGL
ncbi:sorting nexin-29-like isoform X2 [Cimex lectularius]|uniref:Sorting nexin-29 n=1 Tax=Cimex lectularius TaxID=79782 RepID=A0A8I6RFP6_CIMLE|nr:sorting nexin-29-like isoform X2 [Cimex lectularius]